MSEFLRPSAQAALSQPEQVEAPRYVEDFPVQTPQVARIYCPGCEPDADPIKEILEVRWCETHAPDRSGTNDNAMDASPVAPCLEAGGDMNRLWCDLFHRGIRPKPRYNQEPR